MAAEESVQEISMGGEVAAPKVAEILAEVLKSPRMLIQNPTPTKETMKDKKGK